jgi:hypothetical protein
MKRAIESGVRHLALAPMVRQELRVIAESRDKDAPPTVGAVIVKLIWAVLNAEHIDRYRTPPTRDECIGYRLLAEYFAGDAIDSIDQTLEHCIAKSADIDALLAEARSLKQVTDALLAEESARADIAVEEMLAQAHAQLRQVR